LKTARFYLQDMLEFARKAIEIAESEQIELRGVRELAFERCFEIIGEAASKVSLKVRREMPEIPFRKAISMRNRVAHGYDSLSLALLQETAEESLPPVVAALEAAHSKPLPDET